MCDDVLHVPDGDSWSYWTDPEVPLARLGPSTLLEVHQLGEDVIHLLRRSGMY